MLQCVLKNNFSYFAVAVYLSLYTARVAKLKYYIKYTYQILLLKKETTLVFKRKQELQEVLKFPIEIFWNFKPV